MSALVRAPLAVLCSACETNHSTCEANHSACEMNHSACEVNHSACEIMHSTCKGVSRFALSLRDEPSICKGFSLSYARHEGYTFRL